MTSLFLTLFLLNGFSQETLKYQLPPDEITRIVDAPLTPGVFISPDKKHVVISEREGIITIAELSAEELRLAGLRINPVTNGPTRQTYNKSFKIMNIDGSNVTIVQGLPEKSKLGSPSWSPDGSQFAFTNTKKASIELWVCELPSLKLTRIADNLNMIFGSAFSWLTGKTLIYRIVDPERGSRPVSVRIPEGPVVQENTGKQSQARTYQDLLKDHNDEIQFEYFARSRMVVWDGSNSKEAGETAMFSEMRPSPDGRFILTTLIEKPFSYTVPYIYFPSLIQIRDTNGRILRTIAKKSLTEDIPRAYDMILPGPQLFGWRDDKPASLYWMEPLDGGIYENKMEYHDQVFTIDAPFEGNPVKLIATAMRFSDITWGMENYAILEEQLEKTRQVRVSYFDPSHPEKIRVLREFSTDDRYGNPGNCMTTLNSYGRPVLLFTDKGKSLFLYGGGASPEGDRPFIDKYDISTGKTTRLWRSEAPYFETVNSFINVNDNLVITSRQSVSEVPNYFIRNLKTGKLNQITKFENPYPQLKGVSKELVLFKRKDGVDLSFILYLPSGYKKEKDGPLPALLWAYPRDFIDPGAAGQVSGSPFMFTRISPESPLVYVTQGYAILMDASFPIVRTGNGEPNDNFIGQLVQNAEAAIDKASEMGVVDRKRVAVSGHSYGAFMTANLLANSRLFAAGIAESGAYNRTLTPFGFQNERRTYWDAPDLYNTMSPFMHADQVRDPLMLIHGTADNNDGTFPIQSERFYAALKGFGATTRLVLLPNESHGYAARENLLHKHWEVLTWMDRYVKGKK
jgi:dipeptidyl aminopeptidase/acylaminoacyl peptidase